MAMSIKVKEAASKPKSGRAEIHESGSTKRRYVVYNSFDVEGLNDLLDDLYQYLRNNTDLELDDEYWHGGGLPEYKAIAINDLKDLDEPIFLSFFNTSGSEFDGDGGLNVFTKGDTRNPSAVLGGTYIEHDTPQEWMDANVDLDKFDEDESSIFVADFEDLAAGIQEIVADLKVEAEMGLAKEEIVERVDDLIDSDFGEAQSKELAIIAAKRLIERYHLSAKDLFSE